MPHQDDGLPLLLSVAVCLFGSWMGSDNDNGAKLQFHVGRGRPVTLETLRGAARFEENWTVITSLSGKILLCHTKMMDCHCFLVLLYVGLGHEWALAMVLRDNFTLEGAPCHS